MKSTKRELIEMLIESNRFSDMLKTGLGPAPEFNWDGFYKTSNDGLDDNQC